MLLWWPDDQIRQCDVTPAAAHLRPPVLLNTATLWRRKGDAKPPPFILAAGGVQLCLGNGRWCPPTRKTVHGVIHACTVELLLADPRRDRCRATAVFTAAGSNS